MLIFKQNLYYYKIISVQSFVTYYNSQSSIDLSLVTKEKKNCVLGFFHPFSQSFF